MSSVSENFSFDLGDKEIVGHCILFPTNCYIWFGEKGASRMGSLVGIIPTKFDPISTSTTLISSTDECTDQCSNIGRKLSTIFKIPIFISTSGISDLDSLIITTKLKEFLGKYFNKKRNHVGLKLAYEFHEWFDQLNMRRFFSGPNGDVDGAFVINDSYANDVVSRGNLTLNGLSLKLQINIVINRY